MHRNVKLISILLVLCISIISVSIADVLTPIVVIPSTSGMSSSSSISNTLEDRTATVDWYKPPCLSCYGPTPLPTSTPVPSTRVDITFTLPSKLKSGRAVNLQAVQLTGPTVTNEKSWIWQFKMGNVWNNKVGSSITIIPNTNYSNYIVKLQLRDHEHNIVGDASKSTIVK